MAVPRPTPALQQRKVRVSVDDAARVTAAGGEEILWKPGLDLLELLQRAHAAFKSRGLPTPAALFARATVYMNNIGDHGPMTVKQVFQLYVCALVRTYLAWFTRVLASPALFSHTACAQRPLRQRSVKCHECRAVDLPSVSARYQRHVAVACGGFARQAAWHMTVTCCAHATG